MSEKLQKRIKKQSEDGSEKLEDFRKRRESAVREQMDLRAKELADVEKQRREDAAKKRMLWPSLEDE